jgi:ABC-type polysaccharide/polyol phosphate export permease
MTKTSQFAKWAAVATLVIAALYLALLSALERNDAGDGKPTVLLFVFMGVGVLAYVAPAVCILAFILNREQMNRQQKRSKDDHAA